MISLRKLKNAIRQGLAILKREKTLLEGVLYASCNRRVIGRLVYTHHIPCQGLLEPKSDEDLGVSIQGYFRQNGKGVVGFGHVENDVSPSAIKRALDRAKANAIYDPDFHGFPEKPAEEVQRSKNPPDRSLFKMAPGEEAKMLAEVGFKTLEGALEAFTKFHKQLRSKDPNFIVSGDNFFITERMALGNTKGVRASEENSIVLSFVSAMVEKGESKGRGWEARRDLGEFNPARVGKEAAASAVAGVGGILIPTSNYTVVLGPQAAMEIFSNLLLSSFSAASLDFRVSLFNGKLGARIASPLLTIYDDATYPDSAGSKKFSDEGYPTAKIPLIEDGRFTGILMNDYYRKKLLKEKESALREKVGPRAREYLAKNLPRSGFRFSRGGGRIAAAEPGISATNLFITSSSPLPRKQLLQKVKNGVYIGALWYTYPIAGYVAGEITGTAVADTFRIKNGRMEKPIKVNSLRIHANLRDIVKNIIGISKENRPTILWASDEIAYAPEVAIKNVKLEAIQTD